MAWQFDWGIPIKKIIIAVLVLAAILVVAWLARGQDPAESVPSDITARVQKPPSEPLTVVPAPSPMDPTPELADELTEAERRVKAITFSDLMNQWAELHGFNADRSVAAHALVREDLAGALALAESGDIFVLSALGGHYSSRDRERAYDFYYEAALHGSSTVLAGLTLYHRQNAKNIKESDDRPENWERLARQQELYGLAFLELATQQTKGRILMKEEREYREAFAVTRSELNWVCAHAVQIILDMEVGRVERSIVVDPMEHPDSRFGLAAPPLCDPIY